MLAPSSPPDFAIEARGLDKTYRAQGKGEAEAEGEDEKAGPAHGWFGSGEHISLAADGEDDGGMG